MNAGASTAVATVSSSPPVAVKIKRFTVAGAPVVGIGVLVGAKVDVGVFVAVSVGVGVLVGSDVEVAVLVGVAVRLGVWVSVLVAVGVRVREGVADKVGVLVDTPVEVAVCVPFQERQRACSLLCVIPAKNSQWNETDQVNQNGWTRG
ncbi:MAG TPA: hypothetical protein VFD70_08545 [Anaerolineae bacterium]|nr:hypothetical protein [Anaerolineae bacterium]